MSSGKNENGAFNIAFQKALNILLLKSDIKAIVVTFVHNCLLPLIVITSLRKVEVRSLSDKEIKETLEKPPHAAARSRAASPFAICSRSVSQPRRAASIRRSAAESPSAALAERSRGVAGPPGSKSQHLVPPTRNPSRVHPRAEQRPRASRTCVAAVPSRAAPVCAASRADLQPPSRAGARALQPLSRLGPRCLESTLASRLELAKVVPAWVSFGITTYLGLCGPTGHQSSMDIDMTRATRRGPRIPIVLGVPRDTEDQSYVPTGAHVARVRERARDWRTRQGQRQAGERPEVTVASHRDFCFRLFLFLT
uniref:Uncharacterized protein n=1 Tax=Cucumis melo TaxID=3656 RepID=A0A9I9E6E6_CUCME